MPLLKRYNMYLDDRAFLATGGERPHGYIAERFSKPKGYDQSNRRLKIIGFRSLS